MQNPISRFSVLKSKYSSFTLDNRHIPNPNCPRNFRAQKLILTWFSHVQKLKVLYTISRPNDALSDIQSMLEQPNFNDELFLTLMTARTRRHESYPARPESRKPTCK
ncbi:hypothetical protein KC19_VG000800 [Ceratodon purpureus]|uniref:Uncharacterized protein n=1 Tax=Ceratodon purpureus TaxID=3225 RepID=A0A8T0HKI2_CERPU|nr:hypothetical protein KC19_VG000800 [Ceratodon purpureus]